MVDKLKALSGRSKSGIRSAVSDYGFAAQRKEIKILVYDGQPLPKFLSDQGANPQSYRQFLKFNRIGSAFEHLESGLTVALPQTSSFPKHPEA